MTKRVDAALLRFESNLTLQYLLLGLITLVAVGLRFYKLGEWSFWIDEVWSIVDALGIGPSRTDLFGFHVRFSSP